MKLFNRLFPRLRMRILYGPVFLLVWLCADSSVGLATDCGLDGRVRFSAGATDLCLVQNFQIGSSVQAASYPVGLGDYFPGGKTQEEWSFNTSFPYIFMAWLCDYVRRKLYVYYKKLK